MMKYVIDIGDGKYVIDVIMPCSMLQLESIKINNLVEHKYVHFISITRDSVEIKWIVMMKYVIDRGDGK